MAVGFLAKRKKFEFEIMLCVDGRWTIEGILDQEAEATTLANRVLSAKNGEEVKILRFWKSRQGRTFSSEIFHQKRARNKTPPVGLGDLPADPPLCDSVDDLYRPPGLLTISRLLRPYLLRHGLTATELLHDWRHLRKFMDSGSLMSSAIHKLARAQTQAGTGSGAGVRERQSRLEKMTREAVSRARDLAAERKKMPRPDDGDFDHLVARIGARFAPAEQEYVLLTVLSQKFYGASSVMYRLEELLKILAGSPDAAAPESGDRAMIPAGIEAMAAECLDFSEVVQELFGPQPHLAAFLCRLADVLTNRLEGGDWAPALTAIAALIARGDGRQCRSALRDRLVRELAGGKPLDRRSPEKEKHWIEQLSAHFEGAGGGLARDDAVIAALKARKKHLRRAELRKLGLHDAADAL